jgi:manganese transport protein
LKILKKSLEEVNSSIDTIHQSGFWKKLFSFLGPAYLVSVGYMDPGNWATDIAAGSQFGYKLIWVLLMSNFMALLLQSLAAKLGIVRGLDLAQASKESYSKIVNFILYIFAEIAIAACDLAEVLGMAIGLQLLFNIPLLVGVSITLLDTFLLLFLINKGIRKMEAFILGLILIIGFSFLAEIIFASPNFKDVFSGFIPSLPGGNALYLAIGIIGATVMPHNLYLHSSLVQTRNFKKDKKGIKGAIKFNLIDSTIALNLAFFVNAAILVLAAATFYKSGLFNVSEINDAYKFLAPLIGNKIAPILFAIALIAAGQSSTLTGTLAGQIIMEGYLNLRIQPWLRRLLTRLLAIIPAIIAITVLGDSVTGELLILSQVILSLQLGFAIVPLIHLVSDKVKMGEFAIKPIVKVFSWLTASIIILLNAKLVFNFIENLLKNSQNPIYIWIFVVPIAFFAAMLLIYIVINPLLSKVIRKVRISPHQEVELYNFLENTSYSRIAVALDLSNIDNYIIKYALNIGGKNSEYLLIHTVESAGAIFLGNEIKDYESLNDEKTLQKYSELLNSHGYSTNIKIGFGNPKNSIPELVNEFNSDLLVMGSHGHKILQDLIFGTTIEAVRHKLNIPVLIVQK